jgi:hypothetical protein
MRKSRFLSNMQKSVNSPMSPMSPTARMSPMSLISPMNVNAKPFVPENYQRELDAEIKWYESKTAEFKRMNKFIFEDEPELKFILSLENTPFENVEGERFKELPKFKPTLSSLKEAKTWADIAA